MEKMSTKQLTTEMVCDMIPPVHKIVDLEKGGEETVNEALRGRIIGMYRTLGQFADAIGWSRRKVSYIVSGRQEATASDIEQMSEVLNVQVPEEFKALFLK